MAATENIDNYKNLQNELNQIKTLHQWSKTSIELESNEFAKVNGFISKEENEFKIDIYDINFQRIDGEKRINSVEVVIENQDYIINRFSIDDKNVAINFDEGQGSFQTTCSFNELQSIDFDHSVKTKYKYLISTPIKKFPQFHYIFETVTYQDDKSNHFYDCLRIKIKGNTFDLTQIKDEDAGYYLIENFDEMDLKTFSDYSYSIKQALGYVTLYMPGGEEYFFANDNQFYYRNHHRPSIESMFKPLHYNPYNILYHKPEIAEKYWGKLNRMSLKVFSKLVSKIHEYEQFSALILLILDATSIRSFLVIPSLFAVAIESLSKLITKGDTGKEYLISDVKLSKTVMDSLNQIIDNNCDELGKGSYAKLKARIQGLNRPINKEHLTNDEKLMAPFEQLDIALNEHDVMAIIHRNDLLHGNILLEDESVKTTEQKDNYMAYISSKLATLINALILKYVGYEGYIINHAKFYEDGFVADNKEEYYRLI